MSIQAEVTARENITVVSVSGEIDGATAPELQAQVLPLLKKGGAFAIDLKGVTYLSSAGLRLMLLLHRQAAAHHSKIILVGLSEMLKDTMAVTGFLKFFTVTNTVEEAAQLND